MPDIFINFRKADRSLERDRLYRALVAVYGKDAVFKSGVSIPAGADYADVLAEQARGCKLMLALIGPDWMAVDEYGYSPSYWDQMEIATALQAGNTVIPVLLGSTAMLPHPGDLPKQIEQLGRLQFQRLSETSFDRDVEDLVRQLAAMLPPPAEPSPTAKADASTTAPALVMSGVQAGGHIAQVNAQAGSRVIGIQNKKYKLFGAEVPVAALIVGVLGVGGAAVGLGVSATAGGGSAPPSTSASAGHSVSLSVDRCVEVDDNLDTTLVYASPDFPGNSDPNGVCYVWFTAPVGSASSLYTGKAIAIGGNLKYAVRAPDGTCDTDMESPAEHTTAPYKQDTSVTYCVNFGRVTALMTWTQTTDKASATVTLTRV